MGNIEDSPGSFNLDAERASDLYLWYCNEMEGNDGNSYNALQTIAETMEQNGRGRDYSLLLDAVIKYTRADLDLLTLMTERQRNI